MKRHLIELCGIRWFALAHTTHTAEATPMPVTTTHIIKRHAPKEPLKER